MRPVQEGARMTVEYTAGLASFKSGGVNFKLTLRDPKQNGLRYLRR
jgi:hypothetical protein